MKPSTSDGHSAYQNLVLTQLRKYYPNATNSLPSSTWEIMERFWNLDLSPLNSLMQDCYSVFGPAPRQPLDMLRSILLSVEFKIPTVTQWSAELRHNHLYAILSGFSVGNTPGIGTFYDFFHRLWKSDKPNIRDPIHPPKKSPRKPDRKGEKAPPVDKIRIEDLLAQLQKTPPDEADPCSPSSHGRVVKLAAKNNPRLINIPPRDSKEWKLEYNARTSSERCNKRQKIDLKLESGRHRSSRMWYCRLYSIMMCQHLNAWALPKTSSLRELF